MTAIYIPTTARLPVEYIPATQDVDLYRRTKREELAGAARALEARKVQHQVSDQRSGQDVEAEAFAIEEEAQRIRDQYAIMDRKVEQMRSAYPTPQRFLLSVPTETEREQINSRLISFGATEVSQEMIRAAMVEELFSEDWGKGSREANEAEAEEIANLLDSVWLRQEAHNAAIERWHEQERERVLDEAAGALPRPRAEMPPRIISVRENARMTTIVARMTKNQRVRDLIARSADFARRNAILLMRMHLVGVAGFEPPVPIVRDPVTNALPEETVLELRELVDRDSWLDVVTHIDRMYRLDRDEVKNFASPRGSSPPPSGSPEPSGDMNDNGGSSTISSTAPALAVASEPIIGKSSDFISEDALDPSSQPRAFRTDYQF